MCVSVHAAVMYKTTSFQAHTKKMKGWEDARNVKVGRNERKKIQKKGSREREKWKDTNTVTPTVAAAFQSDYFFLLLLIYSSISALKGRRKRGEKKFISKKWRTGAKRSGRIIILIKWKQFLFASEILPYLRNSVEKTLEKENVNSLFLLIFF